LTRGVEVAGAARAAPICNAFYPAHRMDSTIRPASHPRALRIRRAV